MRYVRVALSLSVALLLLSATAIAQEKAPKKKADDKEEVPTYSTKDFNKKYGSSAKAREAAEAKRRENAAAREGAETPLDKMKSSQAAAAKVKQDRAAAQQEVQKAQQEVQRLKGQLRALRNPLLARPDQSDEEKQQQKGLDQAARIKLVEKKLAAAEATLKEAQKKLK